jgi:hypothetical protein
MAASGTTKKVSLNNLLACSPTATLASATITGDLTARTTKVTGSGASASASSGLFDYVAGTTTRFVSYGANTSTAGAFQFTGLSSNASVGDVRYGIDATGIHTWSNVGGVAGTAMTLNATGLGVGGSPTAKLTVIGTASSTVEIAKIGASSGPHVGIGTEGTNYSWIQAFGGKPLQINPQGNDTILNPSSGNVGIGVTPSAGKRLHIVDVDPTILLQGNQTSGGSRFNRLQFANQPGSVGQEIYGGYFGTGALYLADYSNNGILFGVSNTSGTFTERARIDASGNLILQSSATPATLGTNGMLTVNATSNTNLRFSYRGSDGTTRVANITLA